MTRDDIIGWMQEVGAKKSDLTPQTYDGFVDLFQRFADLVAAAEREACAKVCEGEQFELTQDVAGKNGLQHFDAGCRSCAEMIRARGET